MNARACENRISLEGVIHISKTASEFFATYGERYEPPKFLTEECDQVIAEAQKEITQRYRNHKQIDRRLIVE